MGALLDRYKHYVADADNAAQQRQQAQHPYSHIEDVDSRAGPESSDVSVVDPEGPLVVGVEVVPLGHDAADIFLYGLTLGGGTYPVDSNLERAYLGLVFLH